jgi:hypothetical protein
LSRRQRVEFEQRVRRVLAQLVLVHLLQHARRDRGLGPVGAAVLAQALARPVEFELHVPHQIDVALRIDRAVVVTLVQHDGEPRPEPLQPGLGPAGLLQEVRVAVAHDIDRAVAAGYISQTQAGSHLPAPAAAAGVVVRELVSVESPSSV